MILQWGVLASREASANFFPEVLREVQLVPDLWALYGLFKYLTDDHPQTTPEKLSTTYEIQKVKFFFQNM